MANENDLDDIQKKVRDAQDRLDHILAWYRNKAETFKSKGWIVYFRTDHWGEENSAYDKKITEWRYIHPEVYAQGTDFLLCAGNGDVKGFSEARIADEGWNENAKRRLKRIRKMMQVVDYFCFVDDNHYETYIAGDFYGLLSEPLSPDEAEIASARRKIRRGFEKLKELKVSV